MTRAGTDRAIELDPFAWPGAVLGISPDGQVIFSNGRLEKDTGASVVGRRIDELLDAQSSGEKWRSLCAGDRGKPCELILRSESHLLEPKTFSLLNAADGGLWLVEHHEHPRMAAMASEVADVNAELATTQRQLVIEQGRLRHALEELERSNKALDEFAHVVSHDLQAPVRQIGEYARLLSEPDPEDTDDDRRQFLGRMVSLSAKMRSMIADVLEYARAGRKQNAVEEFDAMTAIREVVRFVSPPPGVEIVVVEPMPRISAERVPFDQVFRNLVSNAIEHRRENGVRIEISGREDAKGWVFEVKDNGPGIPESQQEKIFDLFHTTRGDRGGTGLGLALVRRITEAMGGDVSVRSREGAGATFVVRWPMRAQRDHKSRNG